MSTPFQNRLVGSIIVAAAAVIFLPDILDGEKKPYKTQFEEIPKAPEFTGANKIKAFPQERVAAHRKERVSEEIALDDEIEANVVDNVESDNEVIEVTAISKQPSFNDREDTSANKVAKQVSSAEQQVKAKKTTAKASWVIQLGSFRHKKNVEALMKKLEKNGYLAYTRPIKTSSGTLIKVFVGPDPDKATLQAKIPALKKLTGASGKLAPYSPTQK